MIGSLLNGLSGVRVHETELNVIGSNIANLNTVGYKSSRTSFEEALVITLRGGVKPQEERGGLNPIQIGLGTTVSGIDMIFTQGALRQTGKTTDLAIVGDGFFIVSDGEKYYYTRAGDFQFDASGRLVTSSGGYVVQGWNADAEGKIDKNSAISDITLPYHRRIPPKATTEVSFTGNIDSRYTDQQPYSVSTNIYDSQGKAWPLILSLYRVVRVTDPNTGETVELPIKDVSRDQLEDAEIVPNRWYWEVSVEGAEGITNGSGYLVFDTDGLIQEVQDANGNGIVEGKPVVRISLGEGSDDLEITLNFGEKGSMGGLTQFASQSTAIVSGQDGYAAGRLETISIEEDGTILGIFSNGIAQPLAQIALAQFTNPNGLMKAQRNLFIETRNSGSPFIGTAGGSIRATIVSGALEQSNVELTAEFTKLIIAQRGLQANVRVITISDSVLEEMVNIKR